MKILIKLAKRYIVRGESKTIAAFIGIVLSTFLTTSVIILGMSLLHTITKDLSQRYGEWHIGLVNASEAEQEMLINNDMIKSYSTKTHLGFVNFQNTYLSVFAISNEWLDMAKLQLLAGAYPQSEGEVLVSDTLAEAYPKRYSLGCEGEIQVGARYGIEGEELTENMAISNEESFKSVNSISYKVVGIYHSDVSKLGNTGIFDSIYTVENENNLYTYVYAILEDPEKVFSLGEKFSVESVVYNLEYLSGIGISEQAENTRDIVSFSCCLMLLIIIVTAILLISNSFMVSFNERIREFGLLVSVGAQSEQVRLVMLMEALILSAVAIPIGVLSGIILINVAVEYIGPMLAKLAYASIEFELYIHPLGVLGVVGLSIFTVIITTILPMKKAMQISPISAIRQDTIMEVSKNVQVSPYINKCGVEKTIADRNKQCFRKKFVSAIVSVSTSVVLLISVTTLCHYSLEHIENNATTIPYDITATTYGMNLASFLEWYDEYIEGNKEIKDNYWRANAESLEINITNLPFQNKVQNLVDRNEVQYVNYYIVSDKTWGMVNESVNGTLDGVDAILAGYVAESVIENGVYKESIYSLFDVNTKIDIIPMNVEYDISAMCIDAKLISQNLPCFDRYSGLSIVIPAIKANKLRVELERANLYLVTENHVFISEMLANSTEDISIYDVAANYEAEKNTILTIRFFVSLLILLVGIIAFVNTYFTISTNIFIRKKEFVVLFSLGAEKKHLAKILLHECLNHLVPIIIWGYGVSGVISFIIYKSMKGVDFYFPFKNALEYGIAIVLVYVLVYLKYFLRIYNFPIVEEIRR